MNPNRLCGMCKAARLEQQSMADLVAALRSKMVAKSDTDGEAVIDASEGFQELQAISGGCPACILAAIRQADIHPSGWDPNTPAVIGADFDYKKAVETFWADHSRWNDARDYY